MRKTFYLLAAIAFFSSCSVHKSAISNRQARKNNQNIQEEHRDQIDGYTAITSQQYIDRYKDIAIQEMNLYGIPASITLAQGLFESGSGNAELARVANNHFGIKCTYDWKGKSYYKDDDGKNDCFRVYDRPEDSFRDHSNFLKRKNYMHLFELDKDDYKGWAYGLKKAGYATNPKYPQLIIAIIEKYGLDQYDRPEGQVQKLQREDRVLNQISQNTTQPVQDTLTHTVPPVVSANPNIIKAQVDTVNNAAGAGKIYTVHQGDTLYNISKRFGLTVDELRGLNNMADNNIKIGQTLIVGK